MAAGGVNLKMGVSGIAQFKQSINTAKTSLKTLDAQLALNEKQFQATGDKETYMQQKTELLRQKLEEQKAVAATAEKALEEMSKNGVDKASAAFQQMQQTLLKAKADMLDTENAMNGVSTAGEDAGNGVSEMNNQLKRVGQGVAWENVTDGLGKITDGIGNVIRRAWQMGEAIVNATLGAGSWADEVKTTADQYDITPEQLQRMRKTARLIDTDADTILEAQDKLKKNREGGGQEFMGALAYLGIDPNGKNDLDLFWQAGEAIAKLGKDEDKVTYAQRIFGKSWRELLPLFKAGREEYDKTNASWNVVSDEALDNLGKMDDQYQKMSSEWETFKNEMLSAFSGPLTEGMATITGLFAELNKYLQTEEGKEMLAQIGDTISSMITNLVNIDPESVIAKIKEIIEGIKNAFQWIHDNKDGIKTALEVIGVAFAGIKIAELATNIGKVVSGFQTLWSGANKPLPTVPGTPTTPTTPTTGGGDGGGGGAAPVLNVLKYAAAAAAFLTTWGENAFKHQGNDDITDANGNIDSELADTFAYDENGDIYNVKTTEAKGKKYSEFQIGKIQEMWDMYRTNQMKTGNELYDFKRTSLMGESQWKQLMADIMAFRDNTPEWQSVNDLPDSFFEAPAEDVESAGKDIQGAAKDMKKLPEETAAAVKAALNGTQVVINGQELTAIVGQVMAGMYARFFT